MATMRMTMTLMFDWLLALFLVSLCNHFYSCCLSLLFFQLLRKKTNDILLTGDAHLHYHDNVSTWLSQEQHYSVEDIYKKNVFARRWHACFLSLSVDYHTDPYHKTGFHFAFTKKCKVPMHRPVVILNLISCPQARPFVPLSLPVGKKDWIHLLLSGDVTRDRVIS